MEVGFNSGYNGSTDSTVTLIFQRDRNIPNYLALDQLFTSYLEEEERYEEAGRNARTPTKKIITTSLIIGLLFTIPFSIWLFCLDSNDIFGPDIFLVVVISLAVGLGFFALFGMFPLFIISEEKQNKAKKLISPEVINNMQKIANEARRYLSES